MNKQEIVSLVTSKISKLREDAQYGPYYLYIDRSLEIILHEKYYEFERREDNFFRVIDRLYQIEGIKQIIITDVLCEDKIDVTIASICDMRIIR